MIEMATLNEDSRDEFISEKERERRKLKAFQQEILEPIPLRWFMDSVRSLDEITLALQKTGIVSSLEEGRKFIESSAGREIYFGDDGDAVEFKEVSNSEGERKYNVTFGRYGREL